MAITHKIGQTYNGGAGQVSAVSRSFSGDGEVRYNGSIAAASTNVEIDIALDISAVKSIVIYATKGVTIKTNSTSVPDDTIVLADGQAIIWGDDEATDRLVLTADVTKIYVTNAGAAASALRIEALVDVTPGV